MIKKSEISKKITNGIAIPSCEIISGGVKTALKIKIPIKKYFLCFLRTVTVTIFNLAKINKKTGNKKDNPNENNKYIVNFIYSPNLDSNSIEKLLFCWFDSKDKKNSQIIGIIIKYAKNTPVKKRIGIKKKIGLKNAFSLLYNAGLMNNENCVIKNGKEVSSDANKEILR